MSHKIITIGRQFGSGGSEIGQVGAKTLDIPFYDRALIEMASQEMGIDSFELERVDESAMSRFRLMRPDPSASIHNVIGYGLPLNTACTPPKMPSFELWPSRAPAYLSAAAPTCFCGMIMTA